jgi:hypothetical protein
MGTNIGKISGIKTISIICPRADASNFIGDYHKKASLSVPKMHKESPLPSFSDLTDPRAERIRAHRLEDILFIAITSIICGAESRYDWESFW